MRDHTKLRAFELADEVMISAFPEKKTKGILKILLILSKSSEGGDINA